METNKKEEILPQCKKTNYKRIFIVIIIIMLIIYIIKSYNVNNIWCLPFFNKKKQKNKKNKKDTDDEESDDSDNSDDEKDKTSRKKNYDKEEDDYIAKEIDNLKKQQFNNIGQY